MEAGWVFRWRLLSAHLLDAAVVNQAGVGAGASDDEPRPEQLGRQLHLLVVYESCSRLQQERERERETRGNNK